MRFWQIKPFSFGGYDAEDPLDWPTAKASSWLMMGVTAVTSLISLYIVYYVAEVAVLHPSWLFWVEVFWFAVPYALLAKATRKWASWVLPLLTFALIAPLDLYLEAHFRSVGRQTLWMYRPGLIGSLTPLLRSLLVFGGDGLLHATLPLFLSRMLIAAVKDRPHDSPPSWIERDRVFRPEWIRDAVAKPKRGFGFLVFRLISLGYASYLLLVALGALGSAALPSLLRGLVNQTYENPALTINTFTKIAVVALVASLGAWNERLRWHTGLVLLAGHGLSTVVSLFFYFANPAPRVPQYHDFLLISAVIDGVLSILIAIAMGLSAPARHRTPPLLPEDFSLPERLSRWSFGAFSLGCVLMGVVALWARLAGDPLSSLGLVFGFPDPQVSNTLTLFAALAVVSGLCAIDPELREQFQPVVTWALGFGAVCSLLWLLVGDWFTGVGLANRLHEGRIRADNYFVLLALVYSAISALLVALRRLTYDVDLTITTLRPTEARHASALHEAVFSPVFRADETVADYGFVAPSIDRHVSGIRGRKRGLLAVPFLLIELLLTPLAWFRPWFSGMSVEERRWFMFRYLLRNPRAASKALIPEFADLSYKLGTAAHAFVSLAHYSNVRGRGGLYIPAESRARLQGDIPSGTAGPVTEAILPRGPSDPNNDAPVQPFSPPLIRPSVVSRSAEAAIPTEVDYVVIGSGAGGAVAAYRLASHPGQDPTRILVLERGPRVVPPLEFDGDEMAMTRKLYKEGGLQQTKRFDLTVLQGECVGGSTVINNAICVQMPQRVQQEWAALGAPMAAILDEYPVVAREIEIEELAEASINSSVKSVFERAVSNYNRTAEQPLSEPFTLLANHRHQLGTGLCNIGDRRLRKRSTLETYLAWSEGLGVRVVPETTVVSFSGTNRTANRVTVRSAMGDLRTVLVKKAVIVAGGVIASSHLLMRSGIEGEVGQNVACNFGFPGVFEFDERLDAFDGVQIALAAEDSQSRALFETWFSPPASYALGIPAYFDAFLGFMQRYRYLVGFGTLVGTRQGGSVARKPDILNGRALTWEISAEDRRNFGFALSTLIRLGDAAGARRLAIPTNPGLVLDGDFERAAQALQNYPFRKDDLRLVTSHPQGGNGMGRVVDFQGRVKDWSNVYVTDASAFPSGITVNPQWTVMALASYVAKGVAASHG